MCLYTHYNICPELLDRSYPVTLLDSDLPPLIFIWITVLLSLQHMICISLFIVISEPCGTDPCVAAKVQPF